MNTTPLNADEYDRKIEKTIPYYSLFYENIIDLIKSCGYKDGNWLDTGCGTGLLVKKVYNQFPDFKYYLCDPSQEMLDEAVKNLNGIEVCNFFRMGSEEMKFDNEIDVVTAIQSHHYFSREDRIVAEENCFRALNKNGIYITFENTAPDTEIGKKIVLNRWGRYQMCKGKSAEDTKAHLARYNKNYFPITLDEHKQQLKNIGFRTIEVFWLSYMQAGIYAVK